MASVDDHRWATIRIVRDWQQRAVEKPRGVLPAETTSSTLRFLRQRACRSAGVSNCACWQDDERTTPLGEYPCAGCAQPAVAMGEFSKALFGSVKDSFNQSEANQERIVRRWINGAPMNPSDYRALLTNAWLHGWLGLSQTVSLFNNAIRLEANANVLRRFLKRLRERVSFRESGVVRVDEAKLAKEMEVEQHELMGQLLTRAEASIRRSSHISATDRAMLLATDLPQNKR
jgi:hypothetical protein